MLSTTHPRADVPAGMPLAPVQTAQANVPAPAADAPPTPWTQWMEGEQLATLRLNPVADGEAAAVARLCMEHAQAHPRAVEWLVYFNPNVRSMIVPLLGAGPSVEAADEARQVALALCHLEAGFRLPEVGLAPAVQQLLKERKDFNDSYWTEKEAHHTQQSSMEKPGPPEFWGKGLPFFHAGTGHSYSRDNLNGRIDPSGTIGPLAVEQNFVCRHLEQAAAGRGKDFLGDVADRQFQQLNYDHLEQQFTQAQSDYGIHFHHAQFGALCRRLLLEMRTGETCEFPVQWSQGRNGPGHALRVILHKTSTGGEANWTRVHPALYDPNVTGDTSHMKIFPEDLADSGFDDFEAPKTRFNEGLTILSLKVRSKELARACSGQFVAGDCTSLASSIFVALRSNDSEELRSELQRLKKTNLQFKPDEIGHIRRGLECAIGSRHAATLEAYFEFQDELVAHMSLQQLADFIGGADETRLPLLVRASTPGGGYRVGDSAALLDHFTARLQALSGRLPPEQLADLVARAAPGLLGCGIDTPTAAQKFITRLKKLAPYMLPQQLADFLASKDSNGTPCLQKGDAGTTWIFMEAITQLAPRMSSAQIFSLLESRNHQGDSCLYVFMSLTGSSDFVDVFMRGIRSVAAHLSHDHLTELVAAKDRDGNPGIGRAVGNGHMWCALRLMTGLRELDGAVPSQLWVDLARSSADSAQSWMSTALRCRLRGSIAATMAYVKEIAPCLTSRQLASILAATNPMGTTGISLAIADGDAVAVEEYMLAVKACIGHSGPDAVSALLAQLGERGLVGLRLALKEGHCDAIDRFLRGLATWTTDGKTRGEAALLLESTLDWLVKPEGSERETGAALLLKSGSDESLRALSRFILLTVKSGFIDKNAAKNLLAVLRGAQGRRPWYAAGAWVNYAYVDKLKKGDAYEDFRAAKRALKQVAAS